EWVIAGYRGEKGRLLGLHKRGRRIRRDTQRDRYILKVGRIRGADRCVLRRSPVAPGHNRQRGGPALSRHSSSWKVLPNKGRDLPDEKLLSRPRARCDEPGCEFS